MCITETGCTIGRPWPGPPGHPGGARDLSWWGDRSRRPRRLARLRRARRSTCRGPRRPRPLGPPRRRRARQEVPGTQHAAARHPEEAARPRSLTPGSTLHPPRSASSVCSSRARTRRAVTGSSASTRPRRWTGRSSTPSCLRSAADDPGFSTSPRLPRAPPLPLRQSLPPLRRTPDGSAAPRPPAVPRSARPGRQRLAPDRPRTLRRAADRRRHRAEPGSRRRRGRVHVLRLRRPRGASPRRRGRPDRRLARR